MLTIVDAPEYPDDLTADLLRAPYTVVVNGHLVYLAPVLGGAILLAIVVLLAAFALHATRTVEDEAAS